MSKRPKQALKRKGAGKHTCWSCGAAGHHTTSCPQLAQRLLKAVTKFVQADAIDKNLRSKRPLRVLDVMRRPRRSLKKSFRQTRKEIFVEAGSCRQTVEKKESRVEEKQSTA